jgi:hypothetical protein
MLVSSGTGQPGCTGITACSVIASADDSPGR